MKEKREDSAGGRDWMENESVRLAVEPGGACRPVDKRGGLGWERLRFPMIPRELAAVVFSIQHRRAQL